MKNTKNIDRSRQNFGALKSKFGSNIPQTIKSRQSPASAAVGRHKKARKRLNFEEVNKPNKDFIELKSEAGDEQLLDYILQEQSQNICGNFHSKMLFVRSEAPL